MSVPQQIGKYSMPAFGYQRIKTSSVKEPPESQLKCFPGSAFSFPKMILSFYGGQAYPVSMCLCFRED